MAVVHGRSLHDWETSYTSLFPLGELLCKVSIAMNEVIIQRMS